MKSSKNIWRSLLARLERAFIGFFMGIVIGAILGALGGTFDRPSMFFLPSGPPVWAILGAFAGSILGALIGALTKPSKNVTSLLLEKFSGEKDMNMNYRDKP